MSSIAVPPPLARLAVVIAVAVAVPLTACSATGDPDGGGSGGGSASTGSPGAPASGRPLPPGPAVEVKTIADGLTIPWDVVRDPEGVIVTGERGSGTLHAIRASGARTLIEADLGEVYDRGESGLMGIALAADFTASREVYTCHSDPAAGDNRVTAWTAAEDWSALESPRVLLDGILLAERGLHSGCRILAHPDGTLYIGTGDAFTGPAPQDLGSLSGKILHVTRTGAPAHDTIDDSRVLTYGHRNVQGLALRPDSDQIVSAEHGPDVDDEVNLVLPGSGYGWAPDSGGRYDQSVPMTDSARFPDAVEASWRSGAPTLAPGGIAFLDDPAWGEWDGALAVAMLKTSQIVLMTLSEDGTTVTRTAAILRGERGRLRSITPEPGGSLLVTTSNGAGEDEILRVRPAAG
ncbi:PQQ-dependent sugar dehydrogenase [Dietzia massiliensis]|uniref:PQQ-dependent sugar dehydrogenase n=1 Tax=Dietzia massiliensis TaxID=2697499 RepID=UPI001BCE922E|nr:PQQ-dependent sugar dehydrogenase [Dietzia massiliensis]MBS7549014.1 PQQ-dependent sugar dehydrogenase [Dietzia massiliensis]